MSSAAAADCPVTVRFDASTRYRWIVCALLFFATAISYMDRQILALLKPTLDQQLHWTNEQYGMVNSAFQGAYALSFLGFGCLIDRIGTKAGYAISIALWSLAAASHALAASLGGFIFARILLGLGEAGNFPSAIKAVAIWFPVRERALATSYFNSGANVGAMVAPAFVPVMALAWGWQSAFIAAGLSGFVWLIFWLYAYQKPTAQQKQYTLSQSLDPVFEDNCEHSISWKSLFKRRQTWSFIVAKFMTDPIWWFFLIWLPDYFKQTRHLDLKNSWVHLVTIYTIVTVLSIGGGWLTGYLTERGWSVTRARKTGMFLFALCVLPIFFATQCGDWTAVLLLGLAGAAHQAWSANLYTTVSDMFPTSVVASVIGIGSMAGSLGGMLLPIYTGKLLDHFKAMGDITAAYHILFAMCSFAYVIAFVANHLLAPKFIRCC